MENKLKNLSLKDASGMGLSSRSTASAATQAQFTNHQQQQQQQQQQLLQHQELQQLQQRQLLHQELLQGKATMGTSGNLNLNNTLCSISWKITIRRRCWSTELLYHLSNCHR